MFLIAHLWQKISGNVWDWQPPFSATQEQSQTKVTRQLPYHQTTMLTLFDWEIFCFPAICSEISFCWLFRLWPSNYSLMICVKWVKTSFGMNLQVYRIVSCIKALHASGLLLLHPFPLFFVCREYADHSVEPRDSIYFRLREYQHEKYIPARSLWNYQCMHDSGANFSCLDV